MKKILIYLYITALFSLVACKKNQVSVYEKPVEVRVSEFLTSYQNVLLGAENGWKIQITPKQKSSYQFWVKFDANNRLEMVADINAESRTTIKESSYRLKALQQPMLLFDTHNYIHLLADPNPGISGSSQSGTGLESDYQFYPDSATTRAIINNAIKDTLSLVGQFNGIKVNFIKASAEEATAYRNSGIQNNYNALNAYLNANPFNSFTIDDVTYEMRVSISSKIVGFLNFKDGEVTSENSYYAYSTAEANLAVPIKFGSKTITSFRFDQEKKQLFVVFSDGSSQVCVSNVSSIIPLSALIPANISLFSIPFQTTYDGWSPDFVTRRAKTNANTLSSGYNLTLGAMEMQFGNGTMKYNTEIYQRTARFLAVFNYTYTKDVSGIFKFTYVNANGNGNLIVGAMAPLLGQRLNTDTFALSYFKAANGAILGKFTSIEHPDYYFTAAF